MVIRYDSSPPVITPFSGQWIYFYGVGNLGIQFDIVVEDFVLFNWNTYVLQSPPCLAYLMVLCRCMSSTGALSVCLFAPAVLYRVTDAQSGVLLIEAAVIVNNTYMMPFTPFAPTLRSAYSLIEPPIDDGVIVTALIRTTNLAGAQGTYMIERMKDVSPPVCGLATITLPQGPRPAYLMEDGSNGTTTFTAAISCIDEQSGIGLFEVWVGTVYRGHDVQINDVWYPFDGAPTQEFLSAKITFPAVHATRYYFTVVVVRAP